MVVILWEYCRNTVGLLGEFYGNTIGNPIGNPVASMGFWPSGIYLQSQEINFRSPGIHFQLPAVVVFVLFCMFFATNAAFTSQKEILKNNLENSEFD